MDVTYDKELEVRAGQALATSGLTVAVAESCTGGMLGSMLTSVPGSSAYFLGGVIAYADSIKTGLLRVPPEVIWQHGAVSEECALLMAQGVCRLTGADMGISITGVAGPDGGTPAKPVGTVYVGLAAPGLKRAQRYSWSGDRTQNRVWSAEEALKTLIDYLATHTKEAS